MASKPERTGSTKSRRPNNNLYARLEEARSRRAEVLAHKEPANDVARRPIAAPYDGSSRPQSQMSRFPKIVMPPPKVEVEENKPEEKARRWPYAVAIALIAGFAALVIATSPRGDRPTAFASVVAPGTFSNPGTVPLVPGLDAAPERHLSTLATSLVGERTLPVPAPLVRPEFATIGPLGAPNPNADNSPSFARETTVQTAVPVAALALSEVEAPFALDVPAALRVSLNVPVQANAAEARSVINALDQSGYEISAPRSVNFVVRDTQVRFFHAGDAPAAKELAEDIGGIARDFTSYTPPPPPGLVEVYVAGRSAPVAPSSTSRGLAGDIRQLTENIGNALRALGQ